MEDKGNNETQAQQFAKEAGYELPLNENKKAPEVESLYKAQEQAGTVVDPDTTAYKLAQRKESMAPKDNSPVIELGKAKPVTPIADRLTKVRQTSK